MMPRYYEVTWVDPTGRVGWASPDEVAAQKPMTCVTVGRILVRNSRRLTIYGSSTSEGMLTDVTVIPKACVRKIRRLK